MIWDSNFASIISETYLPEEAVWGNMSKGRCGGSQAGAPA